MRGKAEARRIFRVPQSGNTQLPMRRMVFPKKDGEANFNRDTGTPYAVLEDGMVVVLVDNEWIEFKTK